MKERITKFIRRNYSLSIAIGVGSAIGGIALAYFTNDAEPWGTIGGVVCALGLLFAGYVGTIRNS